MENEDKSRFERHWSYSWYDTVIGIGELKINAAIIFPALLCYLGMPVAFLIVWVVVDIVVSRTGFSLLAYFRRWKVRASSWKIFGGSNRNKTNRLIRARQKRGLL